MIAIIDWSETAVENALGYDMFKKIYLYYGDYLVGVKPYTKAEVEYLKRRGWFVYDKTANQDLPPLSILLPKEPIISGRIAFKKIENVFRSGA